MLHLLGPVQAVGRGTLRSVLAVGRAGYLAADAVRALRKSGMWLPHLTNELVRIGVASVPIALFISAFTGIVMAIQASYTLTGAVPAYFVGAMVGMERISVMIPPMATAPAPM